MRYAPRRKMVAHLIPTCVTCLRQPSRTTSGSCGCNEQQDLAGLLEKSKRARHVVPRGVRTRKRRARSPHTRARLELCLSTQVLKYSPELDPVQTTQVYSEFAGPLLMFTLSSAGPLLRTTLSSAGSP